MNTTTTTRRGKAAGREAAARFARLRAADVPMMLTPAQAWHLTGGCLGWVEGAGRNVAVIPLARVARDVTDCENFLDDYREMWGAK